MLAQLICSQDEHGSDREKERERDVYSVVFDMEMHTPIRRDQTKQLADNYRSLDWSTYFAFDDSVTSRQFSETMQHFPYLSHPVDAIVRDPRNVL